MEKFKTIIGGLISFIVVLGVLLRIQHAPGSGLLIVVGASALSFYSIWAGGLMTSSLDPSYKLKLFASKSKLLALSVAIVIVGILFKVQHWPGAEIQLNVGLGALLVVSIVYAVSFAIKKEEIKISAPVVFVAIGLAALLLLIGVKSPSYSSLESILSTNERVESSWKNAAYEFDLLGATQQEAVPFRAPYQELHEHIEKLKNRLFEQTCVLPYEVADTISLKYAPGKDNYDIPTHMLGIADPSNPVHVPGLEEFSAIVLRQRIEVFNERILEMNPKASTIDVDEVKKPDGRIETWETYTFYHKPLAQVILTLNQIQLEAIVIVNSLSVRAISQSQIKDNDRPQT